MPQCDRRPAAASLTERTADVAAPDMSVCIVNWNCRDVLRDCLRSLHHQGPPSRHEIIVVDNASSDGAADMVSHEFPAVCLVRNSVNVGFARANNQAARLAQGAYLLFLNNDTVVASGALERLAEFLDANHDVIMVGPRLRDRQGKVQKSHRRRPTPLTFLHRTLLFRRLGVCRDRYDEYRRTDTDATQAIDVDILMGAAIAMPRAAFLRLGGWDEDFTFGGEDMELCHRAGRNGRIVYWPAVEITHFGSVSSKRHAGFASRHIAVGFAKYFRKTGCSRATLWCYKLAVTVDAPLRLAVRALQYLWRRWRCHPAAERCQREVRGTAAFLLRGLWAFWRA
jgi:GT2 family glycosyltransferase